VRVAALYDIHGNLPALEAVLEEVESEPVAAIVCGGDLVAGPFPAEVFDRLAALSSVRYLRGNADRSVLEPDEEPPEAPWCAERLGCHRLDAIAAWPGTVRMDVAGLGRVLFCHATPGSDEPIFTRITPEDAVGELLGPVDADVVVCGHTHIQFDRRLPNGLRVVNAGSVGMPYEGRPGAFWALLGPDVEFRRTGYDIEEAATSIRAVGYPAAERRIEWLTEPPDPEEVTAYWESQRGA
jgi:predicted phosphodiesterase